MRTGFDWLTVDLEHSAITLESAAEQAAAIVAAVKYPPIGTRGVGLSRAQGYADEFEEHYRWLNEESLVFVQIEHIEAVRNIDAILRVPGVDGFFIGP